MNSAALAEVLDSPQPPVFFEQIRDRLAGEKTRREQFLEEVDEGQKAEFINGEIILHSPARAQHTETRLRLAVLLNTHVMRHRLGQVFDEKSMVHCRRNDYEPDVIFYGPDKSAGIGPKQLLCPPPDLAVEILSDSTESRDRGVKFQDYAASGVREYWIIDSETRVIERYHLPAGADVYTPAGERRMGDRLVSAAVSGFDVPVAALFEPDEHLRALSAILQG